MQIYLNEKSKLTSIYAYDLIYDKVRDSDRERFH